MDYVANLVGHPAILALAAGVCAILALVLLIGGRKRREQDVFAVLAAAGQQAPPFAKRQPRRVPAAWFRALRRWSMSPLALPVLATIGGVGFVGFLWLASPYAPRSLMEVRPLTCAQARAMGFANARIGTPGYFRHLDRDGDGVSCEPVPRSSSRF